MTQDIGQKLEWFLYNLDLQLDDIELENKNKEAELYFDTADLRSAVLGLHDFYRPDSDDFNRAKFNRPERLVHCLATSNWLGQIHLLPPHQAEFLALLKVEFGVSFEIDPVGVARKFLRHTGFTDSEDQIISVSELSQEEVVKLVKKQAGTAHNFFKAIHCMAPWEKRLPMMINKGTLQLNPQKVDYEFIVAHPIFQRLLDAFQDERPSKDVQNLADAIAVILLNDKIIRFKKGESNTIPRLFVTSPAFKNILEQKEFADLLNYAKTSEGQNISVFRDEDYFVFKATFRSDLSLNEETRETRQKVEADLRSLREEVAKILKARSDTDVGNMQQDGSGEPFNKALVNDGDEIRILGRPLSHTIEELKRFSFLENVWLNSRAPSELDYAVRQLVHSAQEVKVKKTRKFRTGLDRALGDVKHNLEENVREVEWVMTLWDGLERRPARIFEDMPQNPSTLNYFRDAGLLRYSFPPQTHDRIEEVLRHLIEKGSVEKYARRFVITSCLRALRDPRKESENLIIAVAVLRIAKMDQQIIELLEKIAPRLPHFSLKIVYAESIFSLLQLSQKDVRQKRQRISMLISELEREYAKTRKDQSRADIAIGLAYLHLRQWRYRGGEVLWRKPHTVNIESNPALQRIINKAINYARGAYTDLKGQGEKIKEAYACNIYLYYLVEGGTRDREQEIDEAANALLNFSDFPEAWQYRFDDTLARYYLRRAASKETEEEWRESLGKAKKRIDDAAAEKIADKDIKAGEKMIEKAEEDGFRGRHKFFS